MIKLAFWTGKDHVRMIRLFSTSALGKRDKWLQMRAYYRNRTASNSNVACRDVYPGTAAERRDKGNAGRTSASANSFEFDTTTKLMTLVEMEANLFFVKTCNSGAGARTQCYWRSVVDERCSKLVCGIVETLKYKDGRSGQDKEKISSRPRNCG